MANHMAMINAEAADSATEEPAHLDQMVQPTLTSAEADVQGYYDLLAAASWVMGGVGTSLLQPPPTHTATPVYTGGGSTGGSSGETTRLN